MITTLLALLMFGQPAPDAAVMQDHARFGAVYERLDGAAAQSAAACNAACGLDGACRAWTWHAARGSEREARCELLSTAVTARFRPGAVTGLSLRLADQIDAAAERAPSEAEQRVLRRTNPSED